MLKYNEYLSLLLPSPEVVLLPGEIDVSRLRKLIQLLKSNYSQIIIDMPHLIDPVLNMVMELTDQIIIVLQQNLANYRDGRRLIQILNKDLDMPLDKIAIVINRYDPSSSLRISDLKSIVNHDRVYTVCSDFARVESATNLGVPLYESSADSKIAHDLKVLAENLGQVTFKEKKKGLLGFLGLKS